MAAWFTLFLPALLLLLAAAMAESAPSRSAEGSCSCTGHSPAWCKVAPASKAACEKLSWCEWKCSPSPHRAHAPTEHSPVISPVIGVLTEPLERSDAPNTTSYIAASYVKFLEASGARVVPLRYDAAPEELLQTLKGLNGLLFPGGGASLNANSTFFESAARLWKAGIAENDAGRPFPMWGTCLGFEFANVMAAGEDHSVLTRPPFDSEDLMLPLNFTSVTPAASALLGAIPSKLLTAMATEPITVNAHSAGVPPASYQRSKALRSFFKVLATNVDRKGNEFVALVEGIKYPVYASQFHPEKNNFEWVVEPGTPIPHTANAVWMSQALANFFVGQARRSSATLPELSSRLIYNFKPEYTGKNGGYFQQEYWF